MGLLHWIVVSFNSFSKKSLKNAFIKKLTTGEKVLEKIAFIHYCLEGNEKIMEENNASSIFVQQVNRISLQITALPSLQLYKNLLL